MGVVFGFSFAESAISVFGFQLVGQLACAE